MNNFKLLALLTLFLSSAAWATTGSCPHPNSSDHGCTTTNAQFVNLNIAVNLSFQNTNVFPYQQTLNSPCIYDNSSCNNGTLQTTLLSGATDKDNVLSIDPASGVAEYTVQQLLDILTVPSFFVGIDVNSTGSHGTETLARFDMYVDGVLTYTLGGDCTGLGGGGINCNSLNYQLLVGNNPGNGYSDDLILGFSLAGFNPNSIVTFVMSEHGDVGGREQFFLIGNVPEPGTLGLIGSALIGLAFLGRRRKTAKG